MRLENIPIFTDQGVNVIIETPRGSQNKYDYEPGWEVFKLKKALPMGMVFPFDFGFIPNTLADDGDPMDVLVIMDEPSYPGCLVPCRLVGALEASQVEKRGKKERNDRLVAIAEASKLYEGITNITDLNETMLSEIEQFFIDYNKQESRKFKPHGWVNAKRAHKLIQKGAKEKV